MPETEMPVQRFIGFDVAKDTITLYDTATGQTQTILNKRKNIKALLMFMTDATLAACEATGGYEAVLLDVLVALGIPAHRADAMKVKAFLRSFGTQGKTDAIDAKGLAHYAQDRHARLSLWRPADKERLRLKILVERRADLVAMRVAEKNRLQSPVMKDVKSSVQAVIEVLDSQIAGLERQMKDLLASSAALRTACRTLQSLKGTGFITAITLLAMMPELGTLTRRQAASLAGLAPHPKDSGTLRGYRRVHGGRAAVRKTIFMAALTACRFDPALKLFYNRLIGQGKKPIVAMTAVMRKMIVILNARLRDQLLAQQS